MDFKEASSVKLNWFKIKINIDDLEVLTVSVIREEKFSQAN